MAIDFNPEEVRNWHRKGFDAAYGDAIDEEFIASLPLKNIKWVIGALPQHDLGVTHEDPRLILIDVLRRQHFSGKIAVTTHHTNEVEYLQQKGADLVLCPFVEAAERAVSRIKEIS